MEERAVNETTKTTTAATPYHWWQTGVIYQVYPRSFADSNGDGVGDLVGITGKLDYLQWLGVDAVWLSPIYPSPMADFGYDVADYTGVHPLFGTLAEFDGLLREAHLRIDVIWMLIKDARFRDNPPNPRWKDGDSPSSSQVRQYSEDQPEMAEIVRAMRRIADSYDERVLIGEIYLPLPRLMAYYGEDLDGIHLPFNFQLIVLPWHTPTLRGAIDAYEAALPAGGWPNWVLGNHDNARIASRIGPAQARVAQMLLLTLRGRVEQLPSQQTRKHFSVRRLPCDFSRRLQARSQSRGAVAYGRLIANGGHTD